MLTILAVLMATITTQADLAGDARTVLEHCRAGRFEEARAGFGPKLAEALTTEKLREVWQALETQFGPLKAMGEAQMEAVGPAHRVRIRCDFGTTSLDALFGFTPERTLEGFFLVPAGTGVKPKPAEPPYVDASKFTEEELNVGAEGWPLGGTLTRPKGVEPAPLVVLLHGSGPHDRDESIGALVPFRNLAHGLAGRGVAVFRFEKRTLAHRARYAVPELLKQTLVQDEVIDDALAVLAAARTWRGVDPARIVVLGHSLGGTAAPEVAKQDGKLAGIVLLAASSRPVVELVREQVDHVRKVDPEAAKRLAQLDPELDAKLDRMKEQKAEDDENLLGASVRYWKSMEALRPVEVVREQPDLPVLVLQGGRDYQVTEVDFDRFRKGLEGRANVAFHLFPDLNHAFVKGEGKSTPAEYQKPGFVDPAVIETIADWVQGLSKP